MKKSILLILSLVALTAFGCAQKKVVTDIETPVKKDVVTQEIAKPGETGPQPPFDNVYFNFDKYDIQEEARPVLMDLSEWLIKANSSVLVEGHCDERGTNEYNLALGDRRAAAVKEFLSASGVSRRKVETISFGEEKPLCRSSNEDCWSRNRRAHFVTEGH